MGQRINSVNPQEKDKPLLAALFSQIQAFPLWKANVSYKINYNNEEITLALSNSVIRRSSKTGEHRYETLGKKPLGDGAYGKVYPIEATYKFSKGGLISKRHPYGKNRVAKEFENPYLSLKQLLDSASIEFEMASKTPHSHAKKPIHCKNSIYGIFRRMEGKELFALINNDLSKDPAKQIPLELRLELTLALLRAVKEQVTDCGLVHRDLKPENIMVDFKDGKITVNIVDYGLSKLSNTHETNEHVGTLSYMSPESLKNENTTPLSDVFSIGQVLVLLWHPKNLKNFDNDVKQAQALQNASKGCAPLFYNLGGMHRDAKKIVYSTIKQMIAYLPENRLSLDEAISNFIRAKNVQNLSCSSTLVRAVSENSNSPQSKIEEEEQQQHNPFDIQKFSPCRFFKTNNEQEESLKKTYPSSMYSCY